MNPFSLNSPVIRFLERVGDLILLNILTVLLSLPIVTIGAANVALHDAVHKMFAGEGTLLKNYFHAFGSNFKQSTIYWMLILLLSGSCIVVLFFMEANSFSAVTRALCFACLLVCALVYTWVFPLQATFRNGTWAMLRNAILCALSWPVRSVLMAVLNAIPLILLFAVDVNLFLWLMPLWLGGWLSICNCLCRMLLLAPMKQLCAGAQGQEEAAEDGQEAT